MQIQQTHPDGIVGGLLHAMVTHVGRVVGILVLVSALLVVAGISLAPDKEASFSPGGEVFDTGEIVESTFRASTTELTFLVEDEGGDALDADTLREWHANSNDLRSSPELSDELSTFFDGDLGLTVTGTYSIADAVDDELRAGAVPGGLEEASNDQVKQALSSLLAEDRPTARFRDLLSVHAQMTRAPVAGSEIDVWTSPAFLTQVRVDHVAFPCPSRTRATRPSERTLSKRTSTMRAAWRSKSMRATLRTCFAGTSSPIRRGGLP